MKKRLALLASVFCVLAMSVVSPVGASLPGYEFTDTDCEGHSDSVARLYQAGLGREPDQGGFEFWMQQYTNADRGLLGMSNFFVASDEFQLRYGNLDQDGFINQMYENVLRRPADDGGLVYWNGRMSDGMTRGELLMSFAESPENITRTGTYEPKLGAYNGGLDGPWDCSVERDYPVATPENGHPGNVVNCSDFETQQQAQNYFNGYYDDHGDVGRLDADDNQIACEGLL